MENLNEEGIKEQLTFLLDRECLSIEEMRWLLNYLEQTEGGEFREILYVLFQQNSTSQSQMIYKKDILNKIWEKIYNKIFG